MNNEKGYTLIEIMIAMAILAIMSAPMLNVFTDSIRINKMADDQYRSDFIAQKFIEDLRVGVLPTELDTTVQYEGFSINIVHKELINNVAKATEVTEIKSNFTLPSIDAEIEMYEDADGDITLKNGDFDLSNPNLDVDNYLLEIEVASNLYTTRLSYSELSLINTVVVDETLIMDDRALTISIVKNSNITLDDEQRKSFTILNNTTKDVEIYVINDQLDNINFTIDPSSRSVKLFRNLTDSTHVSTNTFKSYDVEVTVSKNDTEYTKLKTVISK